MTQLHVVPSDDPPEQHTLGDCPCRPRRRRIRIGEILDWVHYHRSLADEPAN
jgi:hypothetical protein